MCEEPRCDSPMFSWAGVHAPDAYARPHDRKIKEAHPEGAKPLTWLGSLRVLRSARVPLAGKRCGFSNLIPALARESCQQDRTVNSRDEDFNVRLGRIRDPGGGKSFIDQVLRAARKAGYGGSYAAASRRFAWYGHSTFGRGRAAFGRSRRFAGHRRVVLKARVVRHRGRAFRSAPLSAHIAYLERDGVTRDGEKAHMFSAAEDRAEAADFARRGHDDRHQAAWRLGFQPQLGQPGSDIGTQSCALGRSPPWETWADQYLKESSSGLRIFPQ